MTIELITFDLDNTLWESDQVLLRATQKTNAWLLEHVPAYASIGRETLGSVADTLRHERPEILHDVSAFRVAFMERCLLLVGKTGSDAKRLAARAFEVFAHWRWQVEPYPEAERLLADLDKQYQLASITNGNANVEITSINQYFAFNISAETAGAAKPAAHIFHHALELGSVSDPSRAIHVGDSLQDDVEGAANVGMQTIWLDHKRDSIADEATEIVHSLPQVGEAIQRIATRS